MGSGSVGVAALRLGRRFLGNDLNPEAVQLAGERIRAARTGEPPADAAADRSPEQRDLLAIVPTRT